MLKWMRLNSMCGWRCRKKPNSMSLWNPFYLITTTLPLSLTSHYKLRWPFTLPSNMATQDFQGLRIPTPTSQKLLFPYAWLQNLNSTTSLAQHKNWKGRGGAWVAQGRGQRCKEIVILKWGCFLLESFRRWKMWNVRCRI